MKNYAKIFLLYELGNTKMTRMIKSFLPQLRKAYLNQQMLCHVDKVSIKWLSDIAFSGDCKELIAFLNEHKISHNDDYLCVRNFKLL